MKGLRGRGDKRIRRSNGNTKPRIFSYTSSRNAKQRPLNRGEDPIHVSKNNNTASFPKKIQRTLNYIIGAVVLYGLFYLSVLHTDAQVKISGEKVYPRDKSSYEQEIDKQLKSSIFYRDKITFSSDNLSKSIREQFPEVNDIKIIIPLLRHRPIIEISLAKPTAKLVTAQKTYILDEEGRALFEEKYASAQLNTDTLLTINDNSDNEIKLGKPALTERQIAYIREVIGQTSAKGFKPRAFALSGGGTAVDVRFEGLDYFVKFSFEADPKQSSGAFVAVSKHFKQSGGHPQQYIDLRIPEKAFIR